MAKKIKQFRMPSTIKGIQIYITFCALSKKDAAKILDTSAYQVNTYCNIFEPKDECCIKNKYARYAYFDSGELCVAKPEWRNKVMKYAELYNYIHELRKISRSYTETIKLFSKS